jgi:hypothetical protein
VSRHSSGHPDLNADSGDPPVPDIVDDSDPFPVWSIVLNRRSEVTEQLQRLIARPDVSAVARQYERCVAEAARIDGTIEIAMDSYRAQRSGAPNLDIVNKMIEQALSFYESLQIKLEEIEAAG